MKRISIFLFSSLITSQVFAWGGDGHKIVAQIAEDKLLPKTKTAVLALTEGKTLADVANWADTVKTSSQWSYTKPWHFVDIPDEGDYENMPHDENDIVYAITEVISVLKSRTATPMEKKFALNFLVHFVGDIHQPLHVGRPEDHGGNSIKVVFQGKNTNLHALWDSGMISTQGKDYKQYATYLENNEPLASSYDTPEFKFSEVIHECMALRAQIYMFKTVTPDAVILDAAYMDKNLRDMNQRLLAGGKRLAFVLNSIYK